MSLLIVNHPSFWCETKVTNKAKSKASKTSKQTNKQTNKTNNGITVEAQ